MITLHAQLDAGNIEVLDAADPTAIRLAIRKDHRSDFYQWFYFRVSGARGVPLTLILTNAGGAAYAPGWAGYRACYSVDRRRWTRLPDTSYDGEALTIRVTPDADSVYLAYFAPYSWERHQDLIARVGLAPGVRADVLGYTLDGRPLDRLTVGQPGPGKRNIWLIARQHPGESMAEWWMEGLLDRLTDPHDALARRLRDAAVFYVVPNMNPDGSVRGHLRTNAAGVNLNRVWHGPTASESPEVLHCLAAMDQTGVDLCLDVHGDEELPYNFIAGPEGIPGYSTRIDGLLRSFKAAYQRANPDFQTTFGYEVDAPGEANLTMCTNAVAARFDCLAMTLEQPFKDTVDTPDPVHGWSPERAKRLGASALDPIDAVLASLRP